MARSKKDKSGWVVISRSILTNYLWTSEKPFDDRSAWIDLILLANHEDGVIQTRKGELIKVPRGSHFTSIRKLAERWHWSRSAVERFLETLTETQMVTQTGTRSGTLLSLVNYDNFQGRADTGQATTQATTQATPERRTTMYNNNTTNSNNKNRPKSLEERLEGIRRAAKMGDENEKNRRDNQTG